MNSKVRAKMIDASEARKIASASHPNPLVEPVENWDKILDNEINNAAKDGKFEVKIDSINVDFCDYAKKVLRPLGFRVKPMVKSIMSQGFRDGGYFEGFRITWYPSQKEKS